MRKWQMWTLSTTALVVTASGVGVAAAGDEDDPYWPTVKRSQATEEPALSYPTIEDASLTCADDGTYRLHYVASAQPGAYPVPDRNTPGYDGDVQITAQWGDRSKVGTPWGRLPMDGSAYAVDNRQPTADGWLIFGGEVVVDAADVPDAGLHMSITARKFTAYIDPDDPVGSGTGALESALKMATTELRRPDC